VCAFSLAFWRYSLSREHQIIESFLFDLRLCALFDSKELINGDKSTPNQPRIASEGEAWS
jgi:hypothetical protein